MIHNYSILLILALFLGSEGMAQTGNGRGNANAEMFSAMKYRNVGPTRGGRATTATGIPSQPGTFFLGTSGGGLWKTTDYGNSWNPVSDETFTTPSIGAVRVAPSNPDIVYAGTGSDGIRSNVILGKGVFKSTDGGESWSFSGLEKAGQIGAVEIHPENPDVAFVAAIGNPFAPNEERGVFRTTDGGKSWNRVFYHSDTLGAVDLEFHPTNPDIIYASLWRAERKPWTIISGARNVGGIIKSTDGGETWKPVNTGLPMDLIGKIDLAVTPDAPDKVWALVEAPLGNGGGLYLSTDQGESYELINDDKKLLVRPFYFLNIDVNPQNENTLYVNTLRFHRSYDGGKTWEKISTPHGDNHDIWINPNDTTTWIQANDGGGNVTRDNGETWSTQKNQPTAELYQVEVDNQEPYWLYAGQQDNSTTIAVPALPTYNSDSEYEWIATGGCETGPAVPNPDKPDVVYANCKGRFGVYNKETGQEKQYYVGASYMYGHNPKDLKFRFQRVSPIHVSPHNAEVIYHTSQYVHKTTDEGKTWEIISPDLTAFTPETQVISGGPITRDVTGEEFYSTIYAIRESPVEEGVIWVGANDGPISVTRNGGEDWETVTPEGLPPGGRVDCVEPSPHEPGKAYATILRYMLGDWKPYIYKTENYGKSWTLLTDGENGIPADYPVRVVREDPRQQGLLIAGTEYGVFVSMNDGVSWMPFLQNMPATPVTDVKIHQNDIVLSTMGRSFWIMDDITPLQAAARGVMASSTTLFKPQPATRLRYRAGNTSTVPQYHPSGIQIDFYVASEPEKLKLDILNKSGEVIRTYEAESPQSENGLASMSTGFYDQGYDAPLTLRKGAQRMIWDMRHTGAWNSNPERSGTNGPLAAPGTYTARLTVDGETQQQPLVLRIDPKVSQAGTSIEDLVAQEELSLKVRDLLSESRKMLAAVKDRRVEISEKVAQGKGNARKEDNNLKALEASLETSEGTYMQPKLVAQIRYLANMLDQADQRPGQDAYLRYEELNQELEQLRPDWDKWLGAR